MKFRYDGRFSFFKVCFMLLHFLNTSLRQKEPHVHLKYFSKLIDSLCVILKII